MSLLSIFHLSECQSCIAESQVLTVYGFVNDKLRSSDEGEVFLFRFFFCQLPAEENWLRGIF